MFKQTKGGILMPIAALLMGGRFQIDHLRNGEIISSEECKNLVTNEGLDHILNTVFHGSAQITTWYLALFEGNYTPVATLTAATFTAAATENTTYDETVRQDYVEAASAGQSITNSANKATFTMNATKTIYGAGLVSASAKSATTGTLMSAARFGAAKAVVAADQLLLTYTFAASSV